MMNPTNFITSTSRTDGDNEHYRDVSMRAAMCSRGLHYALGLVTEAGEVADAYKKHVAYGSNLDVTNIKEELGDLLWYVGRFMDLYGWTFEEVMQLNADKLRSRYPEKFTKEDAENRDLIKERDILES